MSVFEWLSLLTAVTTGLLSVISIILWYVITTNADAVKTLEKELADYKLYCSNTYTVNTDFRLTVERLMNKMDVFQTTIGRVDKTVAIMAEKLSIKESLAN